MFRCDVCGSVSPANSPSTLITVEIREREYPRRDAVHWHPPNAGRELAETIGDRLPSQADLMNVLALVIGLASLLAAAVHCFLGGREVARPMRVAPFDPVARDTMYACWHLVTVQLVLAGAYLTYAGLSPTAATGAIVRVVATLYLGYAAVFLAIAISSRRRRATLELGQWIGFLPLGIAGWLGTL